METGIGKRLKSYRKKAVMGFVLFMGFMLCCTLISRGIYAWQMPQVETDRMEQKSIAHVVKAVGNVIAVKEHTVLVPAGMRIEEICVREGESVAPETVLFRLSMKDLEEGMEELEHQIALEEQRIKEQKAIQQILEQDRQTAVQRAREDLENVTRTQDMLLEQAKQQYGDAQNALASYPTCDAYCDRQMRQDSQYQMLQNDPEQAEAFQRYAQALLPSLQLAWADGRKVLEEAVTTAATALQMAENDRDLAVLQATRSVEDAGRDAATEKSGIMEAEWSLQKNQEQLEIYQGLWNQNGEILSGVEGGVQTISIQAGDQTPDTASMVLVDGSQGWLFEASLTREQMSYLDSGDLVTLKLGSGSKTVGKCPVLSVRASDGENYLVTVEIPDNNVTMGEIGTLEFSKQTGPYSCCVPLSAVHTADNSSYLYVIRETDTILGTELKVVKRQVTVIDQNDSFAALEEGALDEEEEFVVSSSKEIKAGNTVRPMEMVP